MFLTLTMQRKFRVTSASLRGSTCGDACCVSKSKFTACLRQMFSSWCLKHQLTANSIGYQMRPTVQTEKVLKTRCECPESYSFLLDPSFFNSFLPLEKKLFFFLGWRVDSEDAVLSEGEQQTCPAAGSGAVSRTGAGQAVASSWGRRPVCWVMSGLKGSAGGLEASSAAVGSKSCSEEDVQLFYKR